MAEIQCRVVVGRFAEQQLRSVPRHTREALQFWKETIEQLGMRAMRRMSGYHDEPLKGARAGQRSSRLSRSYRVIYEERETGEVLLIAVLEVNKHDY